MTSLGGCSSTKLYCLPRLLLNAEQWEFELLFTSPTAWPLNRQATREECVAMDLVVFQSINEFLAGLQQGEDAVIKLRSGVCPSVRLTHQGQYGRPGYPREFR